MNCEVPLLRTQLLNPDFCVQTKITKCDTTGWVILKDKHLWFYFIIVAIVAIIAAIIVSKGINSDVYKALLKPSWQPTPGVFIGIWIIVYLFIVYAWFSSDRIADCCGYSRTAVNVLFAVNLFLNLSWVYLFFGAVNIGGALIVLILLLILTAVMIWYLYKFNPIASCLFVLYFLWLLYAFALNLWIYNNNPQVQQQ